MRLEYSTPFDPGSQTDFDVFPPDPAIFALFPEEKPGVPVQPYLSHTRDLRRRLRRLLSPPEAASRRLNLHGLARRIDYQSTGSNFEAQWLLFLLNRLYYPLNFRRRLRLKPPALVKINLNNRFPRCYPARRILRDGALYYGPFPSRAAAERFTSEFLDLFKIRRCLPDLNPDPSHPGCIYSQMRMCLAPCFKGCTDDEYRQELDRVINFLGSEGTIFARELEIERTQASENLEFEQAARAHRKLEKLNEIQRLRPPLIKELSELNAVLVLPGAGSHSVTFFRVAAGKLCGPAKLSLEENVSSPVPLDHQIAQLLASPGENGKPQISRVPPWEHLTLLARWYYSSFRMGEIVLLPHDQEIPHSRLLRLCRKVLAGNERKAPAY